MANETDDLVAGAARGDDAAYEALFDRVASRLLLYIRMRLGPSLASRVEPMDVLQDAYLQAHKGFARFEARDPGSFSSWLYRIVDHRLHDLADHFGAEKRRALREARRGSAVLLRIEAEAAGPGTECARREARDQLLDAVDGLSEKEREAILLRFFHGLTFDAIAQRLEISEPSVRRTLARAHASLGRHLRGLSG